MSDPVMNAKQVAKLVAPPILWKAAQSLAARARRLRRPHQFERGQERSAEWYDSTLDWAGHFLQHYTDSPYYFFWTALADRLVRAKRASVLDIGCGPGQLAALLRDKGVERYIGFDFSSRRIEVARRACPEFEFVVADAFTTELFDERDYDVVVCNEFLEHVEGDLDVLARIRSGTHFFGSVPNFPSPSHVRHFRDADEVRARYAAAFESLDVEPFLKNTKGRTFFLLEGILR